MAAPIKITDETFSTVINAQTGLVVVDFWAQWCAPCRALGPIIDRLAETNDAVVTFAKLNVDENPDASMRFQVQSIPTLLFFRDGTLVDRTMGLVPESILQTKIDQLANAPGVGAIYGAPGAALNPARA